MSAEEYVAEKLRALCMSHKMSKYRLAQITGLSQTTIANMLNGSSTPTISTLKITCDAFGISLAQFFMDDGQEIAGLSEQQRDLLKEWASLDPEKREMLKKFIQSIR